MTEKRCVALNMLVTRFCWSLFWASTAASFTMPISIAQQKSEESRQAHAIVYVGVRSDAKPFSYQSPATWFERVLPGFSGFTVDICRYVLEQMQSEPEYAHLQFRGSVIDAGNRFNALDGNSADTNTVPLLMLCGPDSITEERLKRYLVSHPVFQSGMTYAYINPRSPKFPRSVHCGHVIGVVRGTTADTEGLPDIASRDLLMRFDKALDLELNKSEDKIELAGDRLIEIVEKRLDEEITLATEKLLGDGAVSAQSAADSAKAEHKWVAMRTKKIRRYTAQNRILSLYELVKLTDPKDLQIAVDKLPDRKLAGWINRQMRVAYREVNATIASQITTPECPRGYTSMPIRKYDNHNEGIEGFCRGDVLYYLGDYDIIRNKVSKHASCDVVLNRFTRSKEVYGVYFSKKSKYGAMIIEEPCEAVRARDPDLARKTDCREVIDGSKTEDFSASTIEMIDIPLFYSKFNNQLVRIMQGEISDVDEIFKREFVGKEMSVELKAFFENAKISSFEQ